MKFATLPLCAVALLLFSAGCSNAAQVAEAYEAVCKTNCECPNELDNWNDVKHCKAACVGETIVVKHAYLDRETEPCKDIDAIAGRIRDCANQDCTDIWTCVNNESNDLNTCWPDDAFAVGEFTEYVEHVEVREAMREQITAPFPEPLLDLAFSSATLEE